MMPRPDVTGLGLRHRRIPILALGRDVYLDTRLMLRKLEDVWPSVPRLGGGARGGGTDGTGGTGGSPESPESPESSALERLLEVLNIDRGVFTAAAQLIPQDLPLMRDPAFQRDRDDFFNRRPPTSSATSASTSGASLSAAARADTVNEIRRAAALLEDTIFAGGRQWVLGRGPSLADIEAVWPLHWLTTMPRALRADDGVSATQFPVRVCLGGTFPPRREGGRDHSSSGEQCTAHSGR